VNNWSYNSQVQPIVITMRGPGKLQWLWLVRGQEWNKNFTQPCSSTSYYIFQRDLIDSSCFLSSTGSKTYDIILAILRKAKKNKHATSEILIEPEAPNLSDSYYTYHLLMVWTSWFRPYGGKTLTHPSRRSW
jgi:hypothetical protein